MVINGYAFQKRGKSASVTRRSSNALSNTATSSTNETSSSDISVKQVKLSVEDKDKIKAMYSGLDKSKMWKLSTGTLVEEQMMKHALIQDCEQSVSKLSIYIRC